jgi:hypothetical protein
MSVAMKLIVVLGRIPEVWRLFSILTWWNEAKFSKALALDSWDLVILSIG